MASFQGIEYDYTEAAIAALLTRLSGERGSNAAIGVAMANLPEDAVEVEYAWPNRILVRLPKVETQSARTWWLMQNFLSCWGLFTTIRMRFEEAAGFCRLWLDDLSAAGGLVFSGHATGHVLIPDPNFLASKGYLYLRQQVAEAAIAWKDRADRVFWRGASTGSRHHLRMRHWHELPRFRLCLMARGWPADMFDVGLSGIAQVWDETELQEIAAAAILRPGVPLLDFGRFRHAIDIDGNSNSWPGLFSKLLLGTTVLKVDSALGARQWYYDQLLPWKNFIPVSAAMTELPELALWLRAHAAEAEAIAERGRSLAGSLTLEAVLEGAAARVRAVLRPA